MTYKVGLIEKEIYEKFKKYCKENRYVMCRKLSAIVENYLENVEELQKEKQTK